MSEDILVTLNMLATLAPQEGPLNKCYSVCRSTMANTVAVFFNAGNKIRNYVRLLFTHHTVTMNVLS